MTLFRDLSVAWSLLAEGIRVEAELDIPAQLCADAPELSTIFANILENAIFAAKKLPVEQRFLRCRCVRSPQLMFRETLSKSPHAS